MSRHLKQSLLLRTTLLKTLSAEKEKYYCFLLYLWLRKRCAKEEFDMNVKKILSETGIKLHIKFLNSLSKLSCGRMALPSVNKNGSLRTFKNINNIAEYKFLDRTIPCTAVCTARSFVTAWASGIISVNPDIGKLLHLALVNYLKTIIFTLLTVKKSYKIKANHLKYFESEDKQIYRDINLPVGFVRKNSVSTSHLIQALQLNPNMVKIGFSKYLNLVINGPPVNSIVNIVPLNL